VHWFKSLYLFFFIRNFNRRVCVALGRSALKRNINQ
jgi:hypothetical protein